MSCSPEIIKLYLSSNRISEIDLKKTQLATHILLSNNQLKEIDLSKNTAL